MVTVRGCITVKIVASTVFDLLLSALQVQGLYCIFNTSKFDIKVCDTKNK